MMITTENVLSVDIIKELKVLFIKLDFTRLKFPLIGDDNRSDGDMNIEYESHQISHEYLASNKSFDYIYKEMDKYKMKEPTDVSVSSKNFKIQKDIVDFICTIFRIPLVRCTLDCNIQLPDSEFRVIEKHDDNVYVAPSYRNTDEYIQESLYKIHEDLDNKIMKIKMNKHSDVDEDTTELYKGQFMLIQDIIMRDVFKDDKLKDITILPIGFEVGQPFMAIPETAMFKIGKAINDDTIIKIQDCSYVTNVTNGVSLTGRYFKKHGNRFKMCSEAIGVFIKQEYMDIKCSPYNRIIQHADTGERFVCHSAIIIRGDRSAYNKYDSHKRTLEKKLNTEVK